MVVTSAQTLFPARAYTTNVVRLERFMKGVSFTPDAISTEYRQAGADPVRVNLFPPQSFQTALAKPAQVGEGVKRMVRVAGGLLCVSSRMTGGPAETVTVGHNRGLTRIGFNLSETPLRGSINDISGQMCCGDTYAFSPPTETRVTYPPFCRVRILTLFVRPSVLMEVADPETTGVPASLIEALAGCKATPFCQMTRMTPEMRNVVERIDNCPYCGGLERLYLEAKILELLALRLAQVSEPPRPRTGGSLGRRRMQRLHEAREIVEKRMTAPPSLQELSREVAMSTTLLKSGFRELFGETVFEHVRNLRLERARELLAESDASVKEVAHAVGYHSLSHFAKAFRCRYGAGPRAWGAARPAGATRPFHVPAAPTGPAGRFDDHTH